MNNPQNPSLYQVNTRVWLTEISQSLDRRATLDDIPDHALDQLAETRFDWIWFLSVWQTGQAARKISLENSIWRREFEETLPDLRDDDIGGSGFAITGYTVNPDMGGDAALFRLRKRLNDRGLKLMLDFVPNHMAPDHPWVEEHPDYFVSGTPEDLEKNPQNYTRVKNQQGDLILAFGRDPYFSGWPDTLQLDYSNPATVEAMKNELLRISDQCDGVRCDMAMLVLPEVFEKTWGRMAQPFWPIVTNQVHEKNADFLFMAEVYWDMEWTLLQQGFDYTYDKRLYDRLRLGQAKAVREHFYADFNYQIKMARFLENHDEPRAAESFEINTHKAAAMITFLCPGLKLFHQGQFEGRKKRISPHLIRAPHEPVDLDLQKFYTDLLGILEKPIFRNGNWRLLECLPAWTGNDSHDSFLAFAWELSEEDRVVVCVNYAPYASQCYVRLPVLALAEDRWKLQDLMSEISYERDGNELLSRGLYLDITAWNFHCFEFRKLVN